MDDHHDKGTSVPLRLSTDQVILVSMMVASLGILLVASALGGSGGAIATVGLILAEAIVLYVGYGALTRVISPAARELLGSG